MKYSKKNRLKSSSYVDDMGAMHEHFTPYERLKKVFLQLPFLIRFVVICISIMIVASFFALVNSLIKGVMGDVAVAFFLIIAMSLMLGFTFIVGRLLMPPPHRE